MLIPPAPTARPTLLLRWQWIRTRLTLYERLMRLDKPIGSLLLLWPTLWAAWVATEGKPSPWLLVILLLGTVLMRSAGCIINDFADRDFDRHVARTQDRPLTTGAVSVWEAAVLAFILTALAAGLIWHFSGLVWQLALAALGLTVLYPFVKRFFAVPQAVLGIAFSFGIPMAFAMAQQQVPLYGWGLLAATWFWIMAYDTLYAMADKPDDLKIIEKTGRRFHTSAIFFGRFDAEATLACHILFLLGMALLGWHLERGGYWGLGLLAALILSWRQYRWGKTHDRTLCFRAFLGNNWNGAAIWLGIVLDYLLVPSMFTGETALGIQLQTLPHLLTAP